MYKKRDSCVHCQMKFSSKMNFSFRANHTRWCKKNPKIELYKNSIEYARSCLTKESRNKTIEGIKRAHIDGKYKDAYKKGYETKLKNNTHLHTDKTKAILSKKARESNHRRILKSTRKYVRKDGTTILLDSSWEEALAIRLDSLGIEWIRPNPIKWVDKSGKSHNYFPDFYLPNQNLFLDPKNNAVYNLSLEKIKEVKKLLPNLKILRSLDECKNFQV
jgi:hypothetical protein